MTINIPLQLDVDQESMVLRTVYLPPELDEALRKLAYQTASSKGALIRKALREMMGDDPDAAIVPPAVEDSAPDAET